MAKITWNSPQERRYESGLDRGVLYPPDGVGVPWNGLTAVDEMTNMKITPLYWDGKKYNDLIIPGDYAATLKAFTYPDEFIALEGTTEVEKGMFLTHQQPQRFHLSYRTLVGNPVEGAYADYKIHIVYNCLAKPATKSFETLNLDPGAVEFVWDISAVPEEVDGYTASSHVVFDTRFMDPQLVGDIEDILYGTATTDPSIPSMQGLSSFIRKWARQIVVDNGDGTFTMYIANDAEYTDNGDGTFTVTNANATLDDPVWTINSTDADTGDL